MRMKKPILSGKLKKSLIFGRFFYGIDFHGSENWCGFNLAQGKFALFGTDLIWRRRLFFEFGVDLFWRNTCIINEI